MVLTGRKGTKMTDLEALIILFASYNYNGNYQEVIEAREKIEKALYILEVIKKNLYYDNKNHVIKMKQIRKSTFNFDYEDLKAWLNIKE